MHGHAEDIAVWADTITKSFGAAQAVRGVSLTVPKGMIYGVLGPNGAGKTTTLRMLLGILDPDSGERQLLGIAARAMWPIALAICPKSGVFTRP